MMALRLILVSVLVAGCALEVDNTRPDSGNPDAQDAFDEPDFGDPGTDEAEDGGDGDDGVGGEDGGDTGMDGAEVGDEAVCVEECTRGLTRCGIGGGVETCGDYDDDDCLEWGGWNPCNAGWICELGECVVDCGSQCASGAQRCAIGAVEGIETCGDYDGDSCREWGGLEPCAADLVCDPGLVECLRPYPPGPYGTTVGEVLVNLCLEECKCDGGVAKGVRFCMRDLLDNKATLIAVHSGWCPGCQTQTGEAEALYQAYRAQGLGIVFVLYEDDQERGWRQALLDYGCWEKGWYGLTFIVAIDPGLQQMLPYFYDGAIPLNIIVDDEMVIRYVLEGYDPVSIEATIQMLLAE